MESRQESSVSGDRKRARGKVNQIWRPTSENGLGLTVHVGWTHVGGVSVGLSVEVSVENRKVVQSGVYVKSRKRVASGSAGQIWGNEMIGTGG